MFFFSISIVRTSLCPGMVTVRRHSTWMKVSLMSWKCVDRTKMASPWPTMSDIWQARRASLTTSVIVVKHASARHVLVGPKILCSGWVFSSVHSRYPAVYFFLSTREIKTPASSSFGNAFYEVVFWTKSLLIVVLCLIPSKYSIMNYNQEPYICVSEPSWNNGSSYCPFSHRYHSTCMGIADQQLLH